MLAETIYITSNSHPKHWYAKLHAENPHLDANALYRRFNEILYFYAKYEEPTKLHTLEELDELHRPVSGRRPDTSTHSNITWFDPSNVNRVRARTHMDDENNNNFDGNLIHHRFADYSRN